MEYDDEEGNESESSPEPRGSREHESVIKKVIHHNNSYKTKDNPKDASYQPAKNKDDSK